MKIQSHQIPIQSKPRPRKQAKQNSSTAAMRPLSSPADKGVDPAPTPGPPPREQPHTSPSARNVCRGSWSGWSPEHVGPGLPGVWVQHRREFTHSVSRRSVAGLVEPGPHFVDHKTHAADRRPRPAFRPVRQSQCPRPPRHHIPDVGRGGLRHTLAPRCLIATPTPVTRSLRRGSCLRAWRHRAAAHSGLWSPPLSGLERNQINTCWDSVSLFRASCTISFASAKA